MANLNNKQFIEELRNNTQYETISVEDCSNRKIGYVVLRALNYAGKVVFRSNLVSVETADEWIKRFIACPINSWN